MPRLAVSGLTKDFGGLRAVSGFSFDVEPGEILGLIGPNGAGKTTVFNLVTGFLRPSAGHILLDGANIVGLGPHAVTRRGIARTFQVVKPFPKLSLGENVTLAAFSREASRPRAPWPPIPSSSCSTSPWAASTRAKSTRRARWSGRSGPTG